MFIIVTDRFDGGSEKHLAEHHINLNHIIEFGPVLDMSGGGKSIIRITPYDESGDNVMEVKETVAEIQEQIKFLMKTDYA